MRIHDYLCVSRTVWSKVPVYGELPEGFQLNQVKAEKLLVKGTVGVISSDPSFVERRVLFTTRYLLNL